MEEKTAYILVLSDGTAVKTEMPTKIARAIVHAGDVVKSERFEGYPLNVGSSYFPKELSDDVRSKRRKKVKSNTEGTSGTESVGMC